jgi:DNA polymerase III delta subunit
LIREAASGRIRGMLKPVYALVGEDSFLQMERLVQILKNAPADATRIDVDGERCELSDVFDELRSFAMFGGAKIVVMRNADEFISRYREQLEEYLEHPSNSATLVLRVKSLPGNTRVGKLIPKVGVVEKCEPPKDYEIPGWIAQRAKSVHKINISPDAARLLADRIGADLGRLDNELAKLALSSSGDKVGVEDIAESVVFQREQEMKDMTIELATGRPGEALKRWRQLLQLDPSAEFRATTWLTMWLEDVGVVICGGDTSKFSWKYRDRLPQFMKIAKAMGKDRYARAVDLLAEVDRRSKSGLGDASENVERFIVSFAK